MEEMSKEIMNEQCQFAVKIWSSPQFVIPKIPSDAILLHPLPPSDFGNLKL